MKRMDYNKLTDDSLKEMLSDREIKYNEKTNKEGLINLLENSNEQKEASKFHVEDNQNIVNPKAGAITTIVLSSITLVFGVWIAIGFITLIFTLIFYESIDGELRSTTAIYFIIFYAILVFVFFIGPIISIVVNSRYIKGKNNKVSAGVWGILLGGIIGGILTLCGV